VNEPDFGFDSHLINPIKENMGITKAISEVTMNKNKHSNLWCSVKQMAEIRENFDQILRQKFYRLPKNLRRINKIIELFEETQTKDDCFRTDFRKEIDDDELETLLKEALQRRFRT